MAGRLDVRVRCVTPPGTGAVSVLEFLGPDAPRVLAQLCPSAAAARPGLGLVRVYLAGSSCDEALLVVRSPSHLELHVHGNPLLVEEILASCALVGARTDEHMGAHTGARGSDQNLEARAIWALARCQGELGARILLDQAQGALRREIQSLLAKTGTQQDVQLEQLLERALGARLALRPAQVLLAGPVNAGKSTLFNLMVGRRRVIAHQTPGTTRDLVRESVRLGGFVIDLWDSAGLRPLDPSPVPARAIDAVERAGIRAALEFVERADLVLWLVPLGADAERVLPPGAQRGANWRVIRTHADAGEERAWPEQGISVPQRAQAAAQRVQELIAAGLQLQPTLWTQGQGVPFEDEQIRQLEGLVGEKARDARRPVLGAWLAVPAGP